MANLPTQAPEEEHKRGSLSRHSRSIGQVLEGRRIFSKLSPVSRAGRQGSLAPAGHLGQSERIRQSEGERERADGMLRIAAAAVLATATHAQLDANTQQCQASLM